MKNKKYILALFIIVAILSISAVSAADDDSGSMISADDNQDLILEDIQEDVDMDDELISSDEQSKPNLEESNEDVVGESRTVQTPSFMAIQNVVSGSNDGDTIYLKNQTYYGSGQDIVVGKSLTFIGNDTVLDAKNQSGIFSIPEGVHSITFKNIKFINGGHGTIFSRSINTNFINCTFADNTCSYNSHHNYVIINNADANVNILECTFENNTCPQGNAFLFILANNTVIDKCTFNNIISLWDSSEPDRATIKCVSDNIILKNSNITNNIRHYFYNTVSLYGKSITVSNCNFDNNAMNSSSYANGVLGLYNNDFFHNKKVWDTFIANVENCSFTNNHPNGHAFYNIEVSMTTDGWYKDPVTGNITHPEFSQMNYSNVTLRNIVFDNNEGMALYGTFVNETNINNCSFRNMLPDSYNRLIYLMSNKTTVTDSIFENSPHCCIGDHNDNTDLRVYNCTFVNVGQGICLTDGGKKQSLTVKDCSFINNTNGAIYGERIENYFIDNCNFINNSAKMGAAICLNNAIYVENINTLISNCYFENNNATAYLYGGGAIYIYNNGSTNKTIIDNCKFLSNNASNGGGIYLYTEDFSALTLINGCSFENNFGQCDGGGIYLHATSSAITNCSFMNNSGEIGNIWGVAVYIDEYDGSRNHSLIGCSFINNKGHYIVVNVYGSNSSISNCIFANNSLDGGRVCSAIGENITVMDCKFINNSVKAEDQYVECAGLDLASPNGHIANCIFEGNYISGKKAFGAALYVDYNNTVVENCSFTNNHAHGVNSTEARAGAIRSRCTNLTIKDCTFVNNSCTSDGNGRNGGAISVEKATEFIDCDFIGNSATNGSVLWTTNGDLVTLNNCKFVDQGNNPIASKEGEVDTSSVKYLTAVAFAIEDISDFVNGSAITINVAETLKGEAFNGRVTISIGDEEYLIEISKGVGSITVTPDLSFGKYAAKLIFNGTDEYYNATAESNLFQVSNSPEIKIDNISDFITGSSVTLKVTAVETFNDVVNVVIDGITYVIDVVNGAGSKEITLNLNAGTYKATISYPGNENFTAQSVESNIFAVSPKPTAITASAVTATYSVSKNLVATLKDKTGKAISGVKVTIKLNGKTYTKTTDKNGQVKLGVASLIPKTYTATITFAGNDIYEKSSKNVKVVVKKATPKMTAKAKTFRVKVKVKKYAITLKTNKNKVMKNTKVTLKINKKTFTAKTNKKGVATFKITNLKKKGKFTAVIKYAGSKYYNKLTKKAKITVKK